MKIKTENYSTLFLACYCLCFSLSIALSQICLVGFALAILMDIYLMSNRDKNGSRKFVCSFILKTKKVLDYFYKPTFVWMLLVLIGCFFSLNIKNSFGSFFKFSAYFILPALVLLNVSLSQFNKIKKIETYFFFMFIGQAIAAIHSIISAIYGKEIKIGVPGPLTEAGQIALLFPVIIGAVYRTIKLKDSLKSVFYENQKLLYFLFVLICSALVINLKRGPWLSVFLTTTIFFTIFSLRNVVLFFCISIAICFLPPVWLRINEFKDHFYIAGGRFDMWKLGFQLIERYPLGIGFNNSDMMRKFDPTLPTLHRHMHNNILNVTLESGILAGLLYVWWFLQLIVGGFFLLGGIWTIRTKEFLSGRRYFALCVLLSIFGMQVSGIVEYNFGDGEIRYMFLVLIGLLLSILHFGCEEIESVK